jgi:hypothetical protein
MHFPPTNYGIFLARLIFGHTVNVLAATHPHLMEEGTGAYKKLVTQGISPIYQLDLSCMLKPWNQMLLLLTICQELSILK